MLGAGMLVSIGKFLVPSIKAATPLDQIVRMAASDSAATYTEKIDRERFTQYIGNPINRRYLQCYTVRDLQVSVLSFVVTAVSPAKAQPLPPPI
eukprot:3964558-Amphidinium_carterae.1